MRFPMVLTLTGGKKRKWRDERKETSERNKSGSHVFPIVLEWTGG